MELNTDLRPGCRYDFSVAAGDTELAVILIRGANPGKRLVATAGIHGDEYEGIRALFDLAARLDPQRMRGDLLAVPVANPPAFWNGTRTSPLDGANLARLFPGSEAGTASDQIAFLIDRDILPHADFFIDLHSAGIACEMPALIGHDASDHRARDAAEAFGADVIWAHPAIPPGRTVSAARDRGIPWLYTEMRGAGRVHPDDLRWLERGLDNLLRHLGILEGEPAPQPCRLRLSGDGNIDKSITSTQRGFLIPQVSLLDRVREHQTLGRLVDLHGYTLEEFRSPSSGVVVLIHARPLVQPGEPLFLITQAQS